MRSILLFLFCCFSLETLAQKPCSAADYRSFDFWLGEWEAFGKDGKKAGDSKISLILDSCVVLEEWTSAGVFSGVRYAGKSFNTYNALTRQWQQTWVDNVGGSTEYLEGVVKTGQIVFTSRPFRVSRDTLAIRRLSFTSINGDTVRQLGEISRNEGQTWITEYDLEYRRKRK